MLSHKSLIIVALLLLSTALFGFSISDAEFGHAYKAFDARALAMGSAGVYNNVRLGGIMQNPANVTQLDGHAGLYLSGMVNRAEDVRMVPLYNSFDVYIDDSVLASNINAYSDFGFGAYGALNFGRFKVGMASYHAPYLSFEGNYREEIRNDRNTDNDGYPEKIAQNDIENTGTLFKSGLALALNYEIADYYEASIGVDYALMAADVRQEKGIRWTDWSIAQTGEDVLPEYNRLAKYELSGSQLTFGTALRIGPRYGVGLTYIPKTTLDKSGKETIHRDAYRNTAVLDVENDLAGDFILPAKTRLGFSYFPRNVTRTIFNFDVEYEEYSGVNEFFDDVVNFYGGVEHHVIHRMPLRLGFQATNSYLLFPDGGVDSNGDPLKPMVKKIITPMITGGSGFEITKGLNVDLGFGYGFREYQALDLFPDGYYNDKTYTGSATYTLWPRGYIDLVDRDWGNPDKVKENFITMNVGISYSF